MPSADLSWCETGQSAHVPSLTRGIAQKTIYARFAAESICGFRIRRWCQDIAQSCLVPNLFNCWVLRTSLVLQRAYSPHWQCSWWRIATGCLCSTPTDNLPVLSGIQPAELRRQGATLSLAYRNSVDLTTFCIASWLSRRLLARRDWNLDILLFLPHTTYLSWASAQSNGRTWHGTRSALRVRQRSTRNNEPDSFGWQNKVQPQLHHCQHMIWATQQLRW